MKTKIEFPKVIKAPRWSSTPEQENLRKESIKARKEFWNSLFKEWGYKEVVWPLEVWYDNFILDGITIYFKGWGASEGRCYIRQGYGNEGIWSFFEINKPVNIEKVKDTVKKIWDAASAEKVAAKAKEKVLSDNKYLLPVFEEKFANRNISVVVKETCFEVNIDYEFTFTFDLSGNLVDFLTTKTFHRLHGNTSTEAFIKLRREINDYETKVTAVEKELVEWFKGIKKN